MATLAARDAALYVAMARVAATVAIGSGQIAIVWYGIRAMQRTGDRRAAEQDQRHNETMTALDTLIRQSNAQTATLQEHTAALRELTIRTTREN